MRFNQGPFNRSTLNTSGSMDFMASITLTPIFSYAVSIPSDGDLSLKATITRDMSMKAFTARVDYFKASTAGVDSTTFSNKTVILTAKDHLGVTRYPFVGFYDSEDMDLIPAARKEHMKGFCFAQKLNTRVVPASLIQLLHPGQQYTGYYQRLDFDYVVNNFTAGRIIKGQTSGATAVIVQTQNNWIYDSSGNPVYLVPSSTLALRDVSGTFADNETLEEIGGPGEALVNGVLSQIDILATVMLPQDYIYQMLGGLKWQTETGIYPERINPVNPLYDGSWDSTYTVWTPNVGPYVPPAFKQWSDWKRKQCRHDPIDDLSNYYNFIFYVKWTADGIPHAYWVHQDDIDNPDDYALTEHRGLGLPAAVTVSLGDAYLDSPVTPNIKGDTRASRVILGGYDAITGEYFENTEIPDITGNEDTCTCASGVYYGTEIPVEYYDDTDTRMTNQADVQKMAHLIYLYRRHGAVTWTAVFRKRFDLVFLQKMIFSGFPATEIPDDTYRIIGIEYDLIPGAGTVKVTLCRDSIFKVQLEMNKCFVNKTLETQRVIKAELDKMPQIKGGYATAESGTAITVQTEAGQTEVSRTLET
jgi:hypothetical protein